MGTYVRASWAYTARESNEITFPVDAIIRIHNSDNADWWEGTFEGARGFFPANFVQVISDDEVAAHLSAMSLSEEAIPQEDLQDIYGDPVVVVQPAENDPPPNAPEIAETPEVEAEPEIEPLPVPIPAPRKRTSASDAPSTAAPVPAARPKSFAAKPDLLPVEAPAPVPAPRSRPNSGSAPPNSGSAPPKAAPRDEALGSPRPNISELSAKLGRTLGGPVAAQSSSVAEKATEPEVPTSAPSSTPSTPNVAPLDGKASPLPDDWRIATSPDGRKYYYNVVTKKTQWTAPVADVAAPPAVAASSPNLAAEQQPSVSAARPAAARASSSAQLSSLPPGGNDGNDVALPPNWRTAKNTDGRSYYYNILTKETRWTPPGVEAAPAASPIQRAQSSATFTTAAPSNEPGSAYPTVSRAAPPTRAAEPPPLARAPLIEQPEGGDEYGVQQALPPASLDKILQDILTGAVLKRKGYLQFKIDKGEGGKRAADRKWTQSFSIIHQGFFLCFKDDPFILQRDLNKKSTRKRENIRPMIVIDLSTVGTGQQEYKKREYVMCITTLHGGEVLFLAQDDNDLRGWLEAVQREGEARRSTLGVTNFVAPVRSQPPAIPTTDKSGSLKKDKADKATDSNDKKAKRQLLEKHMTSRPTLETLEKAGIIHEAQFFGARLETLYERSHGIPIVVKACVLTVERRGMNAVGIYRTSGNAAEIQKLRFCFEQNEAVDLERDPRWADVNVASGTLKLFFRELTEPLLTFDLYDQFIEASRMLSLEERIPALKRCVQALPTANREVLKYMLAHLTRVASLSSMNKMEIPNIAIVFGPTLMRPRVETASSLMNIGLQNGVVEQLLLHYMRIIL